MPKVSILLTCYNHLRYLKAAWQSILDQTFQDFEVIALDDGSTDGTREWLSSQEGAKLVFNPQNVGTYATLNIGLHHATGEYIAVFNDDDIWMPTKLERQVAMLDANPRIGLVHTDGWFIDGEGRQRQDSPLGFEFPRTETGDILLALIHANAIIASAVVARKTCFDELGGFNERYFGSGDWEMWYRICEKWDAGYIGEPLTLYRVHGANASHKLDRIWQDDALLREWIAERIPNYRGRFSPEDLQEAEAHNYACLGTVKVLGGEAEEGREYYRRSLEIDPKRWKSRARICASYLPKSFFRKLL
ncbi:MAG: glycosyltransferase [Armatimonadetes bacterium]|nr:glycosyltransferase [Armatimonadota bacterium]MBS1710790.1 glycosyltransferase [Armatimonadota bacterium]MBX3108462.1 glycosyltransferase [Fimbriimonadaceae bacterium]